MEKCHCISARMSISNDVHGQVSCTDSPGAELSVGTVLIRDGTNDYERLIHKPSIEGHELVGDSTLPQIGVGDITEQDIDRIIFGG